MRKALAPALLAVLTVATLAPAQSAEELVPFEKLDVDLRDELWKVTQRYTVRRKVEEKRVACSTDTYEWLLEHLPLASVAAREMDMGKYVIEDKGDKKFSIDDSDGAFANCERVFSEKGRLVIVARGDVEVKPLPKIKGTGVIIVRWKKDEKDEKKTLADCHIFFRVASDSLHLVTSPFRDSLGKVVGSKIEGFVDCAVKESEASEKDPDKVLKALEKSKKIKDEELDAFKKKFMLH